MKNEILVFNRVVFQNADIRRYRVHLSCSQLSCDSLIACISMRFSDEAIAVIPQNDSLETIIRLIKNKSVMTICYVERKSKVMSRGK